MTEDKNPTKAETNPAQEQEDTHLERSGTSALLNDDDPPKIKWTNVQPKTR